MRVEDEETWGRAEEEDGSRKVKGKKIAESVVVAVVVVVVQ